MEAVLQISLLTLSVGLGAIALVLRSSGRSTQTTARISVDRVSSHWLAEHRVRSRAE